MGVLIAYMSVYHVYTQYPLRSEKCAGPLGTGATNSLTAIWVLALNQRESFCLEPSLQSRFLQPLLPI